MPAFADNTFRCTTCDNVLFCSILTLRTGINPTNSVSLVTSDFHFLNQMGCSGNFVDHKQHISYIN